MVDNGKIVNSTAEQRLFPEMIRNPEKSAEELSEANGWLIQTDSSELTELINSILNENPNELERLKSGEKKLIGFFMGQIMKASRGSANPKEVTKIISELIEQ